MKYHYQDGISEKQEGGKLKLVFFGIFGFAILGYASLLALTPVLNGWPLIPVDQTANALESSDPGDQGNKLYIPRLNINTPISSLELKGNPSSAESVTIKGQSFQLGLTPEQTRQNSPFYYIDQLKSGDEIFLDFKDTRYAYRVSSKDDSNLTLKSSSGATIKAEAVGTVARENGKLEVEDLAF